jgi:hypothetical protein
VRLELELDAESVQPGGTVAGRVHVVEGGDSRELTLTLTFYEHTRDFTIPASQMSTVVHEGALATGDSYEFSVTLPDDAVPSVETKNGKLYWELELRSDERGLDTHLRRELRVSGASAPAGG